MASLSNINGIFDVHSTGAILFSTSHGASGQILRSNGNAAPTWVAASTVIGGPYLPLTGGTLSGATATASGISFTVGGNLFVTGTSTLTGALSGSTATFSGLVSGITPTAAANFTTKAYVDAHPGSGGTVTSIATSNGITGGTITTTGTVSLNGTFSGRWNPTGIQIVDSRSGDVTPANEGGYSMKMRFTNQIPGNANWQSLIQMKGWHSGYTSWQIIGPSTTSAYESWYLRSGLGSTWNTTREIWHSGNFTPGNYLPVNNPTFTGTLTGPAVKIDGGKGYDFNASGSSASVANMFCPGSYTLAFGTNNTERIRIDSSGNVGINTTVFPSSGFAKLVVAGGAIAARPSGVNDYFSYIKSNWALENAFEIGIEGAGTQHRFITSGNYYHGTELRFWSADVQRMTINSSGNVGIGITTPKAKLDVDGDVNTTGYNSNTLEFSTFFTSGTNQVIATLSSPSADTTCVATIEYVSLYNYGGTNIAAGLIMASTRYLASVGNSYQQVNDITISLSGNDTGIEPTLFWVDGINNENKLKINVPSSAQVTARIRITYHNATLTRNYAA